MKLQFQEAGQHVCQERKTCDFDVKPAQEAALDPDVPWSHTTAHSLNKTFIECLPRARRQNQVVDNKNPKGFPCPRGASSLVGEQGRPYRRPRRICVAVGVREGEGTFEAPWKE